MISHELKLRVWDVENAKYLEDEVMWSVAGVPQDMMPGQPPFIPFMMVALKSPATKYIVEQFTGLLDKSGREIYEGDIIKDRQGTVGKVKWISTDDGWDWSGWQYGSAWSPHEIVGNTHQTPDLLKD